MLRMGHPFAQRLSQVDVEALADCVAGITDAMKLQGRQQDVPALLDHAASVVPLAVFSQRMLATKAVWFDAILNDNRRAVEVLSNVDAHTAIDHQLIEAVVAIREVRDPVECIRLMDRAISLASEDMHRVWNLTTKAMLQSIEGDEAGTRKTLAEAATLVGRRNVHDPDLMDQVTIAKFYGIKWKLGGDEADFLEAMKWYESIDLSNFTASGRADLLHQIGTLQGDHGDTELAIRHVEKAYALDRSIEAGVRLVELLIEGGQYDRAETLSGELLPQAMAPSLRAEYLTGVAALSVHKGDEGRLRKTLDALRMLHIEVPYFAKQRDHACAELLTALNNTAGDWRTTHTTDVLLRLLRVLCKLCNYLELKPNIYGVGINLNKVMERVDQAAAGRTGLH
ncbi:MAG TPA: hypothetical protein VHN77_07315 [Phycisphaerales bacterium]|nr:hypothetical protein [Phycisphaerales bacterium]